MTRVNETTIEQIESSPTPNKRGQREWFLDDSPLVDDGRCLQDDSNFISREFSALMDLGGVLLPKRKREEEEQQQQRWSVKMRKTFEGEVPSGRSTILAQQALVIPEFAHTEEEK